MAELKKCPFCDGEAKYEEFNDGFFTWGRVECQCGVMLTTPTVTTIKAWNNRVTEAEIRNKAIDEFVAEMFEMADGNRNGNMFVWCSDIKEIAEQLKEEWECQNGEQV